jgi:hypothetical protein
MRTEAGWRTLVWKRSASSLEALGKMAMLNRLSGSFGMSFSMGRSWIPWWTLKPLSRVGERNTIALGCTVL